MGKNPSSLLSMCLEHAESVAASLAEHGGSATLELMSYVTWLIGLLHDAMEHGDPRAAEEAASECRRLLSGGPRGLL